jgi:hypothetical protein
MPTSKSTLLTIHLNDVLVVYFVSVTLAWITYCYAVVFVDAPYDAVVFTTVTNDSHSVALCYLIYTDLHNVYPHIVNVDYLDMVPIVQISRDSTSILLCEYYHVWTIDYSACCMLGVCLGFARGSYTGSHTLST